MFAGVSFEVGRILLVKVLASIIKNNLALAFGGWQIFHPTLGLHSPAPVLQATCNVLHPSQLTSHITLITFPLWLCSAELLGGFFLFFLPGKQRKVQFTDFIDFPIFEHIAGSLFKCGENTYSTFLLFCTVNARG